MSNKKKAPIQKKPEAVQPVITEQTKPVEVNQIMSNTQPERGRSNDPRPDLRAAAARARKEGGRVSMGGRQLKLSVKDYAEVLEGKVARWVNDDGMKLSAALESGYLPVYSDSVTAGDGEDLNTDLGTWVSQVVGTKEGGQPQKAYLLAKPKAMYDSDQAEKLKPVDAIEEQIKRGAYENANANDGGRYSKQISFESNRRT